MACNTCVEGVPLCPRCWSPEFTPLPAPEIRCLCAQCNLKFWKPYCVPEDMLALVASGEIASPMQMATESQTDTPQV